MFIYLLNSRSSSEEGAEGMAEKVDKEQEQRFADQRGGLGVTQREHLGSSSPVFFFSHRRKHSS